MIQKFVYPLLALRILIVDYTNLNVTWIEWREGAASTNYSLTVPNIYNIWGSTTLEKTTY